MISHVNVDRKNLDGHWAHTGPYTKVPSDVPFKVDGNRDSRNLKTATGDVEA